MRFRSADRRGWGQVGFVNAALELGEQIKAGAAEAPDHIYLACGTTGTVAGLGLGFQLAGVAASIEAVQVTPASMQPEKLFRQLFRELAHELGARENAVKDVSIDESGVNIRDDQLGDGYAMPTDAAREAVEMMRNNGVPASLTYTGKAMAGLMADAGRGILAGKKVLFWNTFSSRPYPELPGDDSWKQLPEDLHNVFRPELL